MNEVLGKIMEHTRPIGEADFLKSIFGPFAGHAVSGSIPVVLFGAGSAGQELYPNMTFHGVNPVCFCDNNASRIGSVHGAPVVTFEELVRGHKESLIVITSKTYSREIASQLLDSGFKADRVLQIPEDRFFYYARFCNYHLSAGDLTENAALIEKTYNLLADRKSKELFMERLGMFASGADYPVLQEFLGKFSEIDQSVPGRHSENSLYFNNDLLTIQEGEALVDAGAFVGDSADELVETCERLKVNYKAMYCFEPDFENFEKLLENTSGYRGVECFRLGLWSHSTTLRFASSAQIDSFAARVIRETGDTDIIAPRTGDLVIETTSIDEMLADKEVTFIKMDIEGAEAEALQGAARTIRERRPKLVISAYHKKDDIFKLPLIVNELCSDYRLYMRHFSDYYFDTVLVAVI